MSDRLVLIPWKEYSRLKEKAVGETAQRLYGEGLKPRVKQTFVEDGPVKQASPPPIPKPDKSAESTADESNTTTLPHPPGVLARDWLTWT
jgi:hypothetical protein